MLLGSYIAAGAGVSSGSGCNWSSEWHGKNWPKWWEHPPIVPELGCCTGHKVISVPCCRHEQLSWTCSLHGNSQWGKYYFDFIPEQKLCKQPLHVCHQISSVTSFFLFMSTTAGVAHEWEYDSGHWPPGARSQSSWFSVNQCRAFCESWQFLCIALPSKSCTVQQVNFGYAISCKLLTIDWLLMD